MLNATDCDSLQQLTPKQQAAIDLLLSGKNDRETAEAVGAHRTTISRWRLHDLAFVDELNRRRREVYGAAGRRWAISVGREERRQPLTSRHETAPWR